MTESRGEPTDSRGRGEPRSLGPRARRAWRLVTDDLLLLVVDVITVVGAYGLALGLRFDGDVPPPYRSRLWLFLAIAVPVHVAVNTGGRLYGRLWREAGVREARALLRAGVTSTSLLFVVASLTSLLPRSAVLVGGGLVLLLAAGARFRRRLLDATVPDAPADGARVVLVGSVDVAKGVIDQMLAHPEHRLVPVAVVNGRPEHWGRSLSGVPVLGPLGALPEVAHEYDADQAVLTLADDDPREVRRAADTAREAGLAARILPNVRSVVDRPSVLRDIRDLSIDDLLGREQARTDMDAIRGLLHGRRVLITGGGGSIGSEIARQVADFEPERLLLVDHDETHLFEAIAGLQGRGVPVLADIREADVVDHVFSQERPEIVFHAAAHKHVPILEEFPTEAVRTNVCGTQNILRAAVAHETDRVVVISTDKAVNPCSVMGATKRLGEQLLLLHQPPNARYCAVRFGNVLGSRGSVIPTFLRQIEQGGPVTVTHPDMTRYFMSIHEAVLLVLQASVMAEGGEVFMLDMGEPVRILELAERLIFLSGSRPNHDVHIEFTGVRPGEKLVEETSSLDETERATTHPHIRLVETPSIDARALLDGVSELGRLAEVYDQSRTARLLLELASATPALPPGPVAHRDLSRPSVSKGRA